MTRSATLTDGDTAHAARNGLGDGRLRQKVEALSRPAIYPHGPDSVEVVETHMSFVFLAGERVYKLKKPVRYPFLDFTTLAARRANCEAEVRLNRRLAPEIYLGVVPLVMGSDGTLALHADGEEVDVLVVMRRLPEPRMLDRTIAAGRLVEADLDRIADTLAAFYSTAERPALDPADHLAVLAGEQARNREVIGALARRAGLEAASGVLESLDARIAADRPLLEERVRARRIVDGHGDLKPEHVCLVEPVVVFDCLEFARRLRLVDPFDEIAFLGLECALLAPEAGAAGEGRAGKPGVSGAAVGPALRDRVAARLGDHPPERLFDLYTAFRAVLRARLSLAHLLDAEPREPERWGPQAARYLRVAADALG